MTNDSCPLVSVVMTAYNHERYVEKAIQSILAQDTDFRYELIIHEDASVDGTASIIEKLERRHPDIIKVIYQKENQFSAGRDICNEYIFPLVKGKYIAFCEGDDYWIDRLKLQKQIDYLEAHSNCSAVYHNCVVVDENDIEIEDPYGIYSKKEETNFNIKDVALSREYPGQTSSRVCRREVCCDVPEEVKADKASIRVNGDKLAIVYSAMLGYIHVLPDVMSAYRVVDSHGSSWSARNKGKNRSGQLFLANKDLKCFVEKYTRKQFPNDYAIFHNGVAVLAKCIMNRTEENIEALKMVLSDFNNVPSFLVYLGRRGISALMIRLRIS